VSAVLADAVVGVVIVRVSLEMKKGVGVCVCVCALVSAAVAGYGVAHIHLSPVLVFANEVVNTSTGKGKYARVEEWLVRELYDALNPEGRAQ
jgi:hypothetical protein